MPAKLSVLLFVAVSVFQGGTLPGPINIQSIGAKCDGTTDDTAFLQTAIMAAEASNQTLTGPPGKTCLFSSTLLITNRLSIIAHGLTLLKTAAVTGITINSVAASFSVLEGFTLDNNKFIGGPTDGIVIGAADWTTNGQTGVVLRDLTITHQLGNGISVFNGNDGIIENVSSGANSVHGVDLDSRNTGGANVNGWTLMGVQAGSNGKDGIHIGLSHSNTVIGFDSSGNGQLGPGYGVYDSGQNNFIQGHAEGNATNDLKLDSASLGVVVQMMAGSTTPIDNGALNQVLWNGVRAGLQNLGDIIGPAMAPSGTCPTNGVWVFSQDGHATFCASGTWATKI